MELLHQYIPQPGDTWYVGNPPPMEVLETLATEDLVLPSSRNIEYDAQETHNAAGDAMYRILVKKRAAAGPTTAFSASASRIHPTVVQPLSSTFYENQITFMTGEPHTDRVAAIVALFQLEALQEILRKGAGPDEPQQRVQLKRYLVRRWCRRCVVILYGEIFFKPDGTRMATEGILPTLVTMATERNLLLIFPSYKSIVDLTPFFGEAAPVLVPWTLCMLGRDSVSDDAPQSMPLPLRTLLEHGYTSAYSEKPISLFLPLWLNVRPCFVRFDAMVPGTGVMGATGIRVINPRSDVLDTGDLARITDELTRIFSTNPLVAFASSIKSQVRSVLFAGYYRQYGDSYPPRALRQAPLPDVALTAECVKQEFIV